MAQSQSNPALGFGRAFDSVRKFVFTIVCFRSRIPSDEKDGKDFKSYLNPNSLEVIRSCQVEPGLAERQPGEPLSV